MIPIVIYFPILLFTKCNAIIAAAFLLIQSVLVAPVSLPVQSQRLKEALVAVPLSSIMQLRHKAAADLQAAVPAADACSSTLSGVCAQSTQWQSP